MADLHINVANSHTDIPMLFTRNDQLKNDINYNNLIEKNKVSSSKKFVFHIAKQLSTTLEHDPFDEVASQLLRNNLEIFIFRCCCLASNKVK